MTPSRKFVLVFIVITLVGAAFWFTQLNTGSAPPSVSQAVITRQDLLDASDVAAGVKQAVANNDTATIKDWLAKAVSVAEQAGLPPEDIDYLKSEQAIKYVTFQAKRSLFNDEVQQAYYAVYDIDAIKGRYPQAQDLFDQADKLIAARNRIIRQIAETLADGQPVTDEMLIAAREQWKQKMQASQTP